MSGAWQGLIPFLLVTNVAIELDNVLPLEAVLKTELLDVRASRPPDYELENSCLKRLLNGLRQSPGTILEQLTEVIIEACSAGSAGITLIHEKTGDFWWPAIAGKWTHHVGNGTPRNFSPCAEVVARNRGLLFCLPERRYTYLKGAGDALEEVLLAPFHIEGNPLGTVWAIHHTPEISFDSEDLRRLMSCAAFASSAYLIRKSMNESQKQQACLAASATRQRILSEALADLLKASSSDTALRGVFAKVSEHLRIDMYFNYMLREGEDKLTLHSYSGISAETAESITTLRIGEAICGKVAQTQQPVIRCDIQNSTECDAQLVRGLGVKAYACNPLMAGERLLGTLSFASTSRDSFDDDELAFMALISKYVSVAMLRVESETMLKDTDRRKDEFLAMLSHELRNPLAPIHSGIQVLKEKGDDHAIRGEVLSTLERQSKVILCLINDLFDVSRIGRGKFELRFSVINLNDTITQALESVGSRAEQLGHQLYVEYSAQPLYVRADATRLTQVFSNLLSNAVKFTPHGGKIDLEVLGSDRSALISVKDNGVGFAPELHERIFDMFQQAGEVVDKENAGIGIGLTLVRSLVELHGGKCWAHSHGPGCGSTFYVELPLVEATVELRNSDVAEPTLHKQRVLIVDDQADVADMLGLLIKLTGHEVRQCYSGNDAIALGGEFQPDVILMDIGMPELDGLETAKRMRRLSWGREAMLVALTGWGQEDDRQRSYAAGFDYHLVKPVEPAAVRKLINELRHA